VRGSPTCATAAFVILNVFTVKQVLVSGESERCIQLPPCRSRDTGQPQQLARGLSLHGWNTSRAAGTVAILIGDVERCSVRRMHRWLQELIQPESCLASSRTSHLLCPRCPVVIPGISWRRMRGVATAAVIRAKIFPNVRSSGLCDRMNPNSDVARLRESNVCSTGT
jgi:acylphosphatase